MRRIVARLLLLFALFVAARAQAIAGTEPAPRASADVREGTTEVLRPRVAASADAAAAEPAPAPTPPALPSSVADAPATSAGTLRMPPLPDGFNRYDGGWVQFVYHPSSRERVQPLIAQADLVRQELIERLGFPALSRVRVEIARTPGEMATFAPPGAPYPEYAAGVAYSELGLVLLSLTPVHAGSEHDVAEVFRHELAHVALHDAVEGQAIPRWFNEGFAVFASGETSFVRMKTLSMATVGGGLIPLRDIDRGFPSDETEASIAYAEAVDVVRFLVRREDLHRFRALVEQLRNHQSLDHAVFQAYGIELNELESEWREDVSHRYTLLPILLAGTFGWVVALGVFVWAWRRRKRRDKVVLERWAREEAAEDVLRARLAARSEAARVHIVLSPGPEAPPPLPRPISEVEIPRVEHNGQWHTLH